MFQTSIARKLWGKIRKMGMQELTRVKVSNDLGFSSVIGVYANTSLKGDLDLRRSLPSPC